MADASDGEGAPEEFTLVEGRDAAEMARKQEQDSEKRVVSEAKQKRRRQDERNREAKLKKMETKKKLEEQREKEEEEDDDESDLEAGVMAMKKSGFLDESIVQFLVDKERKEATALSEAREDVESRSRRKAAKRKSSSVSIDKRTKLVVLTDAQSHARRGSDFLKQRLLGPQIQRSATMLKRRF